MSTTRSYDRESFLDEFFPEADERVEVEAGAQRLVNQSRAHRLAEMRRRLGLTQAELAERMHVRQERVSAIERAKVDVSELRTLSAYIRALGWPHGGDRRLRRRTPRRRLTSAGYWKVWYDINIPLADNATTTAELDTREYR